MKRLLNHWLVRDWVLTPLLFVAVPVATGHLVQLLMKVKG